MEKYYPENKDFSEISVKFTLRTMLDHTVSRISEMMDILECVQDDNY